MDAMELSDDNLTSDVESAYDVFDIRNIPSLMSSYDESINLESQIMNMNSIEAFMFLSQNESKVNFGLSAPNDKHSGRTNDFDERLSLAYERLHGIPKVLLYDLAPRIKILDISHNEFDNLDFLKHFKQLTTLICDRNNINSTIRLPYMPKLELFWLNHCKINELYPCIKYLQESCPNLQCLSLMGNRGVPSIISGGNKYEYLQYRLFVISFFSNLLHLDEARVTESEHREAKKIHKKPILEKLCPRYKLPAYLRTVSEMFTMSPVSSSGNSSMAASPIYYNCKSKNVII